MKVSRRRLGKPAWRFQIKWLVDQTAHFVAAEGRDHALDLPPVAETRDIPLVAAAFGARRGLITGIVTEAIHQLRRVSERKPSVNEGHVHGSPLIAGPFR